MQFQSGAVIDTRPADERAKDWHQSEVVSAINPVEWREKPKGEWRSFPIFNQNGSGSCVAQTLAKLLGVMYWLKEKEYVHFSATHIYQQRANKPAAGMGGVDAFSIATKGITLESLVPSQSMTDAQMDTIAIPEYKKKVGEVFKVPNYLQLATKNIDTVASTIQTTGKAVMVWFYFNGSEWVDVPTIKDSTLDLYAQSTLRHSVTAVDFTLYEGKKCLIIEDSWGPNYGLGGQRIITEDFFKERNWFAAYPINFIFEDTHEVIESLKVNFAYDMQYGMTSNDVAKLQAVLKVKGLFPINAQCTGYYGAITKKAVQAFQDQYRIATQNDPGYGRVGPRTRAVLNSL